MYCVYMSVAKSPPQYEIPPTESKSSVYIGVTVSAVLALLVLTILVVDILTLAMRKSREPAVADQQH